MADSPSVSAGSVVRLSILSNGQSVRDNVQVVSVSVTKAVNRIPTARIVMLDGDMPNQDFPVSNTEEFTPGTEIEVKAGYDDTEESIFKGVVVRHGIKVGGDNYARLVVDCQDGAVRMTIGRKSANFMASTDDAAIQKLITAHNLAADVATTATEHTELVQYYATDWDFMVARAEVNGLLVIVNDGRVSVQAPDAGQSPLLTVAYGVDIIEFEADLDARTQLASVKTTAWDPKTQQVVDKTASADALTSQGNLPSSSLSSVAGPDELRLQTAATLDPNALTQWGKGQQLRAALARIRGRVKFEGSAKPEVGGLIELQGVGERFNGNVFVSAVHHEIVEGGWTTEVEFGLAPDWFADRRDLVSPPAAGVTPAAEGLQIGVVKKLDADPDGEPRVQVSIPVLEAETDGVWARLARFYSSDGYGAFFIPEIGDEVVVGYFNNDPSHPVVLGSLYSSKRKPPYDLTADNFSKAIVTRSKLKVEFDDDKKVITIATPAANTIVLSDDSKSILMKDENGNEVELGPSGIRIESPKDIQVTAKGTITIDAVGQIGITSKADVTTKGLNVNNEAQVGFTAKGNATAELSASGQTTVKGAMVMIN